MNNQPAGNMLMQALKKLLGAILKVIALVFAWLCELLGKILFKISEIVKNKSR